MRSRKRVAHDHAHPGARAPLLAGMAQPAQHHRECREAEIRLGLAAARREEEQVDGLAVRIARVGEAGEVQQDERELEGAPARRFDARAACCSARATARFATRKASRASASSASTSMPRSIRSAATPARRRSSSAVSRRVSVKRRESSRCDFDPVAVLAPRADASAACGGGAIRRAPRGASIESSTPATSAVAVFSTSALGNPGGAEHAARAVGDLPIGRDAVASRVLGRVGVVEVGDLLVPVLGPRAAQVRPGDEWLVAPDLDLRLEGVGEVGLVLLWRDGDGG